MAVALVRPEEPDRSQPPLVYLAGGPGNGSIRAVEAFLDNPPTAGTTVLLDYRGVGASEPSLACPEVDELALAALGAAADDPELIAGTRLALSACRERLVAAGIDLAAYNYTEIAEDLADLRIALGFREWDLYGISNGGRVALEVVRRHPDGVRALVLDAALPPQGNLPGELFPHAARAFEALADGCRASPSCSEAFGDLDSNLVRVLESVRDDNVVVEVPAADGSRTVAVRFSEESVLNALREALYDTTLIPLLPFFINELAMGRSFEQVAQLIVERSSPSDAFSTGMSLSVNCQEEVAFLPDGFFAEQAAAYPLLAPVIEIYPLPGHCAIWDVGRADASIDQPVTSDVPALVMVGEYDPVHPRSSSESIVAGFPNATLVEFPGLGHGTSGAHPCPHSLRTAFLSDPTAPLDLRCVDDMTGPDWVVP